MLALILPQKSWAQGLHPYVPLVEKRREGALETEIEVTEVISTLIISYTEAYH